MTLGTNYLTSETLPDSSDPASTVPGQAHFANWKIGALCSACQFHAPKPAQKGQKRYCAKAAELSGKWLQPVPSNAVACKYFSQRT